MLRIVKSLNNDSRTMKIECKGQLRNVKILIQHSLNSIIKRNMKLETENRFLKYGG